jgi:hypothetical protein
MKKWQNILNVKVSVSGAMKVGVCRIQTNKWNKFMNKWQKLRIPRYQFYCNESYQLQGERIMVFLVKHNA